MKHLIERFRQHFELRTQKQALVSLILLGVKTIDEYPTVAPRYVPQFSDSGIPKTKTQKIEISKFHHDRIKVYRDNVKLNHDDKFSRRKADIEVLCIALEVHFNLGVFPVQDLEACRQLVIP